MELLSTWLKSMHHAHRDNDHKGNIRENALCRKSDVGETIKYVRRSRYLVQATTDHSTSGGCAIHMWVVVTVY
jgi:hypothetical protein